MHLYARRTFSMQRVNKCTLQRRHHTVNLNKTSSLLNIYEGHDNTEQYLTKDQFYFGVKNNNKHHIVPDVE